MSYTPGSVERKLHDVYEQSMKSHKRLIESGISPETAAELVVQSADLVRAVTLLAMGDALAGVYAPDLAVQEALAEDPPRGRASDN